MMPEYPHVPFRDFARPVFRPVAVEAGTQYRTLGVKWWGEGAYERDTLDGTAIRTKTLSRVRAGDLIFNKIWVRHGSSGVIPPSMDGCVASGEFPTFELDTTQIDHRWLLYLFKTKWFWEECDQRSQGTSGKNRIRPTEYLQIEIPLPRLTEQRRIVARIEALARRVEEARGLRKEALAEVNVLANSKMAILAKALENQYQVQTLGSLLTKAGYGTSAKCDTFRDIGDIPVLRIPNVVSERVVFTNLKYASLTDSEQSNVTLEKGDVLVVRTNGSADLVGRCAVVPSLPEKAAFASYLIRIRCDSSIVDPSYLQLILRQKRTGGQLIDFARTTAGQYNVSLGRLRAIGIPLPAPDKQREIVSEMDMLQAKVDKLAEGQVETQKELDALMPSILAKAFAGEL